MAELATDAPIPAADSEAAPAIRALGSLFKVTEVFLWDDAVVDFSPALARRDIWDLEAKNVCITDTSSSVEPSENDKHSDYAFVEDLELAQQMGALGLPISFSTTREKKNIGFGGKRKGMRVKSLSADKDSENRERGLPKAGEWEDITSSRVLNDSTNVNICCNSSNVQTEVSYDDYQEHSRGDGDMQRSAEASEFPISSDAERLSGNDLEDVISSVHHAERLLNEENEASSLETSSMLSKTCVRDDFGHYALERCSNSGVSSVSRTLLDRKAQDYSYSTCYEYGDWRVFWDAFYMRYYFYNCQTQESTWYPPAGLEHFAPGCSITNTTEMITDQVMEAAGFEANQDVCGLHDRADSFQEGRNCECINLLSEEVSSKNGATCNSLSGIDSSSNNCASEILVNYADTKEVAVHSSDVKDQTTDQLVIKECVVTQEECSSHPEAYDVPENFLEVSIEDSSTSTPAKMCREEILSVSLEMQAASIMDQVGSHQENVYRKRKPRVRRPRSYPILPEVIGDFSVNTVKYWCQRYLLFSKFDNGIKMDEEGWFSVTPESIARHHASRCGDGIVIDCFTGVGGNAIQFAMKSKHVIALDIDPQKIDYARHNAAIYGVIDNIDFIIADFFQVAHQLKGDVVFLSPPWGGPNYSQVETYDLTTMLLPHDGYSLFEIAKAIAPKIVMFLPRNVDMNQLAELSLSTRPPCALEVEKNYVNGKLKAITAYFITTAP